MEEQPSLATLLDNGSSTLDSTLDSKIGIILTVNTALATCVSNNLCMSKRVAKELKESFRHLKAPNPHERSSGNVLVFLIRL